MSNENIAPIGPLPLTELVRAARAHGIRPAAYSTSPKGYQSVLQALRHDRGDIMESTRADPVFDSICRDMYGITPPPSLPSEEPLYVPHFEEGKGLFMTGLH